MKPPFYKQPTFWMVAIRIFIVVGAIAFFFAIYYLPPEHAAIPVIRVLVIVFVALAIGFIVASRIIMKKQGHQSSSRSEIKIEDEESNSSR
jgi:Zn-dependent protease with chaperone function